MNLSSSIIWKRWLNSIGQGRRVRTTKFSRWGRRHWLAYTMQKHRCNCVRGSIYVRNRNVR